MRNRSCHRLLRWLKRAALRSKSRSKQRYKMFLNGSASSSPSKSPMHYAHTDGGVSAIRCLDQSVDEPPDSPARAPTRCLRAPTKASVARTFAVQGLPRVGETASSRELLSTDSSYFSRRSEALLASDALTTVVPFGGRLSSGSAVRFPVKRSRLLFIAIFDVFHL
jgi:hypothetical protein